MGEIVALAVSFCWSLNSIQFTLAGRRVGSGVVNRTRLMLAVVFLSLVHLMVYGTPWPVHAEAFRWGWLGLSGTIGLVLGDGSLFYSFLLIGPRRAMVVMTLVPVISTLAAWGLLGEMLLPLEIVAVLTTVAGIAAVVSERGQAPKAAVEDDRKQHVLGLLFALGGALGQALGLVAAKRGLVGDFPALSATLMRMMVATAVIWSLALVRRQAGETIQALKDKKTSLYLVTGAIFGPFIGVWLSLMAVRMAPVGLASTLMSLSPIILIPFDHWLFDERVTPRSIGGTVIALIGAGMIFLT